MLRKSLELTAVVILLAGCAAPKHYKSSDMSSNADDYDTFSQSVAENATFEGEALGYAQTNKMDKKTFYFELNKASLDYDDEQFLNAHADYLKDHPNAHIRIEGHTDERGSREYNVALGEKRATTVAKYLRGHGVQPNQYTVVSFGKEKPVMFGHDENSWGQNRRAAIVYEKS